MILQAWLTLPSCFASSRKPTLARMIFWSWVIVMVSIPGAGGRGAVPARGENRAPPPGTHFETNNDCQIKCKLLHVMDSLSTLTRRASSTSAHRDHRTRDIRRRMEPASTSLDLPMSGGGPGTARIWCVGRCFRHRRPIETARRGRRKSPPQPGVFATLCRRPSAGAEREPRRQDQFYIDQGSPIK